MTPEASSTDTTLSPRHWPAGRRQNTLLSFDDFGDEELRMEASLLQGWCCSFLNVLLYHTFFTPISPPRLYYKFVRIICQPGTFVHSVCNKCCTYGTLNHSLNYHACVYDRSLELSQYNNILLGFLLHGLLCLHFNSYEPSNPAISRNIYTYFSLFPSKFPRCCTYCSCILSSILSKWLTPSFEIVSHIL
jgi:hypothetical protein